MAQYLIIEGTTVVGAINLDPGDTFDPGAGRTLVPLEPTTASVIQNNYAATTNPTANDDSGDGYAVGSFWVNTVTKKAWQCSSASVGAAVWNRITVPIGSTIITVDLTDPNADYSNLTDAVAAATTGDSILLGPGDHAQTSTLAINKSITIRGAGRLRTTITRSLSSAPTVQATVMCGTSSVTVDFEDLLIELRWSGTTGTVAALHLNGNGSARLRRARAYVTAENPSGGGTMSAAYMQTTSAKSLTLDESTLGALDIYLVMTTRTFWVEGGNFYFTNVVISGSGVCAYINYSGSDGTLENFVCGTFTIAAANSVVCYGLVSITTVNDTGNVLSIGRAYKVTGQELWLKDLTADPAYLRNGMVWHRSDLSKLFARRGATTRQLGDADGPASATDGAVALFDGTTGKLLKNGFISCVRLELGISSGAVITTGAKGRKYCSITGTIIGWRLVADVSTTCVLDIWKANASIPTNANSITASAKPGLTAAQLNASTTLTGWTTAVADGDVFILEVESNNNAKYLALELWIKES